MKNEVRPMATKSATSRKILYFCLQAAIIAALYAGLSYAGFGISYGPVQFRFAEALTLLACLTPSAIPGLALGCALANLGSPYGLPDILVGTAATLLAACLSYAFRRVQCKGIPWLSALMPVIMNGVCVGAMIAYTTVGRLADVTPLLVFSAGGWIALSELGICFVLGVPLLLALRKLPKHILNP
jgi:uncharacterized membrane protein